MDINKYDKYLFERFKMNIEQMRALNQAIDSTWGSASTQGTNATMSIKANLFGESGLHVLYTTIVNLGSIEEWHFSKDLHEDQAKKAVDEYIKSVKEEYKEITDETLKVKSVSKDDSFELISMSAYSPRKTAYYRVAVNFEVQE